MIYNGILDGKNIYLRNITLDDCGDKYLGWMKDKEVVRYLEARLEVQTKESIRKFVGGVLESSDSYMFAMVAKEREEHIGNIKIAHIHPVYKHADLGSMIGEKRYWGRGVQLEALYLASKFAFEHLGLHRIHGGVIKENKASIFWLERIGFKIEGVRRDAVLLEGKYTDCYEVGLLKGELEEIYPPPVICKVYITIRYIPKRAI